MQLSPRLHAIAQFIPHGCRVADVGTDHGYLPIWLRTTNRVPFVIASDLRTGPLDTAKQNATRARVDAGIDFRLADGLSAIFPHEVEVIVMSGLGGETIAEILDQAPWVFQGDYRLILQPQSKIPLLLDRISTGGYHIADGCLVEEAGKIYPIYMADPGEMEPPTGGARYIPSAILDKGGELLDVYLLELCKKLSRALSGLSQARDQNQVEKKQRLAAALQDLENWRRK